MPYNLTKAFGSDPSALLHSNTAMPSKSLRVTRLEQMSGHLEFLPFGKPKRITTDAKFWQIIPSDGVVEILNLEPLTSVQITARFCDESEATGAGLCGEYRKYDF